MTLNEIYHAINPVAFQIGSFQVYWYGIAYLLGFLFGGLVVWKTMERWHLGIDSQEFMDIMIGIAFGVIIGGHLGYVLFYGNGYYLEDPMRIFSLRQGGMSFHGGLVGAIIGGAIACKIHHICWRSVLDLGCIGAPLGLFFGRCANFINGELWGKPTDLPWGVLFETGGNVYRHPSQLYEALLEGVILFVVLFALSRRKPPYPQGIFFGLFALLYGIFRFAVEFVRVPDAQLGYLVGFLTMGQLLSIPLIVFGIVELILAHKRQWPQQGHCQADKAKG